jgi:hypothetical protein
MADIHQITKSTRVENGSVVEEYKDMRYRIPSEEDYIKLYVKTISVLHDVEGAAVKTLNEMLKLVDYKNRITLAPVIKDEIAAAAGLKKNTVEHHIIFLCRKKLLIKLSTNMYTINTYVFGRGKWADIIEHRKSLPLVLDFRNDEVTFLGVDEHGVINDRKKA